MWTEPSPGQPGNARKEWTSPTTESGGYATLMVSVDNTNDVLYLMNRPGNRPHNEGAAEWLDHAIAHLAPVFKNVWLRGDTDFFLTRKFNHWDERVGFVFWYDAKRNLLEMADALPKTSWVPLERLARYVANMEERARPENAKEKVVKQRECRNIRLESEQLAESDYRPVNCRKIYCTVVVRKDFSVEKGENRFFDETRHFYYITNDRTMTPQEIVLFANDCCNQENVLAQLKSGVNALRMPSDSLVSNWAYMVIATLTWNLKAWYGMVTVAPAVGRDVLRMEFKRFLVSFIQIPCQIMVTGRRLIYKILTYSRHLESFLFDLVTGTEAYVEKGPELGPDLALIGTGAKGEDVTKTGQTNANKGERELVCLRRSVSRSMGGNCISSSDGRVCCSEF